MGSAIYFKQVLRINFEVNTQHASGLVTFCYPLEILEPVLEYLDTETWGKRQKEKRLRAKQTKDKPEEAAVPVAAEEPEAVPSIAVPEPEPISPGESVAQIAARRPEDVAGVIQTLLAESEGGSEGPLKIAILVAGLGVDLASKVLGCCSRRDRAKASEAIPRLRNSSAITVRQKDEVFNEVKERLQSGDYALPGGVRLARQVLQDSRSSGFSMLRNVAPNQIIPFISTEHPQTIALIVSQLDSNQAAGVLSDLPDELQADVAYRIAVMDNISSQVLRDLEGALGDELQAILSGQITEIGGPKTVAEILNRTGRTTEKAVLKRLDAQDPELAKEVRNQLFVFDDIANLTDREIQIVLREVDMKDLAVGLKGGSEKLQDRIFGNLSEEIRAKVKEEMQFSGPVRMSDVEEVQLEIVQLVRQFEEEGKVTIVRGDPRDKFV